MSSRPFSRQQFLLLSAASAAFASLLEGCSSDDDSGSSNRGGTGGMGSSKATLCSADIDIMSSGSHQHSLLVTAAQIAAGVEVTILSGTTLSHAHYVKITAADFVALKAGMEVRKKSCAGGDHEYVLKCGGGGSTPMDPTDCTDECGDGTDPVNACP
jgi:hypothetical protein